MKIGKLKEPGLAGVAPPRSTGDPLPDDYVFGRPTTYRPEYCEAILDFFERDPWEISYDAKGTAKMVPKDKMPTAGRWCREMGVPIRTFNDWVNRYPEFADAYATAQEMQKSFILESGGIAINGGFAMFMLKCNHGMKEPEDPTKDKDSIADQLAEMIGRLPS